MKTPAFGSVELAELNLLPPTFFNVPKRLRALPTALWIAEPELDQSGKNKRKRNGRLRVKKAPRNILGNNISKSRPSEWETFERCREAFSSERFSGIGCLIMASDNIVAIDLDDITELLETNPSLAHLLEKAEREGVYCETSPSRCGLRLFVRGALLMNRGRRKGGIELYSDRAFLSVTGAPRWAGDIKAADWLIDGLLSLIDSPVSPTIWGPQSGEKEGAPNAHRISSVLTDHMQTHHRQLWSGTWSEILDWNGHQKYPSQSEADMALISHLVRRASSENVDSETIRQSVLIAYKNSGLYRSDKERQIADYALPKAMNTQANDRVNGSAHKPIDSSVPSEIAEVNIRFGLIEGLGIYDKARATFIKPDQFALLYKNRFVNLASPQAPKYVTLDKVWLASNYRAQYLGLELSPGSPERTAAGALNTYRGFSIDPQPGQIDPFMALLSWLIPTESDRAYLLKFMAYKLQHPMANYSQAAVLWSTAQGVGKNLIAEAWASLFDVMHWGVVGQEVFADQFTDWQHLKLIVIADEVSSTASRSVSDRIKGWVTATKNRINNKGLPRFEEDNRITYVFLSNHPDAVFIDDSDRRFFVVQCTQVRPSPDLVRSFVRWRENGGREALLNALLVLDCQGFNPREPAPMTTAKREMIEDNKSDLDRWLGDILGRDDLVTRVGREIFTLEELTRAYRLSTDRDTSGKAMNCALARLGIQRLSKQARRKDGTRPRIYSAGDTSKYESMSDTELGRLLDCAPLRIIGP